MPLHKAIIQTGINQQWTQSLNNATYWAGNLIRFRDGMVEKIGGWTKLFTTQLAGLARSLHAFEDLTTENNLLIGTDQGPQVYVNSVLYGFDIAQKTSYYLAPSDGNISCVMGSTTVTVTDPNFEPVAGQQVFIGIPIYLGGGLIPPQIVTVATTPSGSTWTFVRAFTATSSDSAGSFTTPLATSAVGTSIINIELFAHGYTMPGQIFQVGYAFAFSSGGGAVPAGNYPIVSVVDVNNFTIMAQTVSTTIDEARESPTGLTGQYLVFQYLTAQTFPTFVDWYIDNFGGNGLFSFTQGPIYQYVPPIPLGQSVAILTPIPNAPIANNGMLVAMPQAQIIAWGSTPILGSSTQDPLLIRFCDAGDDTDWTATTTNQAGSFRLSRGSKIIGGIQIALTTLIFTDTDVWTMQYIGPPFVYSFNILASGCGMIAPKACAILGGTAYWMSQKQFYLMGSGGAQAIPCPIWDIIFNDIDQNNLGKINMGANSAYGEVLVFWPSASGGTGEIDSYAIFKPGTGEWSYGSDNSSPNCSSYSRTAWLDQSVFGSAIAGDLTSHIQQHDTGYDADGTPMAGAYVETGYASIDPDGDQIMLLTEVEPDFKWFGNVPGAVTLTVKGVDYAQGTPTQKGPYGLDMQNRKARPRMRKRFIALRWDWFPRLGFNGRLGAVRVRAQPSGRRP